MRSRFMPLGVLILLALSTLACTLASGASSTARPTAHPGEAATLPPIAPGTIIPTRARPTAFATATVAATNTPIPTVTPAAPTATTPPKSTGPLGFSVTIEKCRLDPSREGGVILTLRIDAYGGNGVYTYYHEGQQVQRIFDRPATKGTAVIDAYRVISGDGQVVENKIRFTGSQFGCP